MDLLTKRLLKRALDEKQYEFRKRAFIPMGSSAEKTGAQAPGPGGAPVDPMAAGGAPMDPMAAGGAPPMDPMAAGGAPPMDPMAAGGAPMDPMAGGAPMDPMAGGMPPLPPLPEEPAAGGGEGVTPEDAETVDKITERTLDVVRQTLEMVGKAKPVKAEEEAEPAQPAPEAPAPEAMPGPVTGQPGFDPATFGAPKIASAILTKVLKHAQVGEGISAPDQIEALKAKLPPRPPMPSSEPLSGAYSTERAQQEAWARRKGALDRRIEEIQRRRQQYLQDANPTKFMVSGTQRTTKSGPLDPDWLEQMKAKARAANPNWPNPPNG